MLYQLEDEYTEKELANFAKQGSVPDERRKFIGVSEWLGEKYGKLKHLNVSNGGWQVSPSDFLFIPEAFASLMKETYQKHIPCKGYVIVENFRHISEFIPFGDQWATYGITDAIVCTEKQSALVKSVFKYVNTYIISEHSSYYNKFFAKNKVFFYKKQIF